MHPVTAASPSGTIEASVLVGGTAQPFYRRADGRAFAAGAPGRIYTLRVRNRTGVRAEVIATVDGRHVLKDEPGDPRACQGLVIPAHGEYEFRGWRVSDDQSREFLFGEPASSVAAQATGSTANIGVIGFAAWSEREVQVHYGGAGAYDSILRGGAPDVAFASAGPVTRGVTATAANTMGPGSLGTGIGAHQDDRVGRTDFTRTGEPDILVIGYDTEAELTRRGILGPADPDAFPGARTGYERYATA